MSESKNISGSQVGLASGTKIGKYEIVERLGMGGQAVVYKGYDALLDRYVAIKQISTHLAEDKRFLERFKREAQILARLGAEVITIHDLVEDERGLFIVMEYVEGHTLETVIRETNGPVEAKAVLQILWRLAATLHEVHSAGIIHRDLKPSNIIIAEGLRPRITDFGVAASVSGQTSMVLGTTKYMAPELYGEGGVDGRADIYSVGFIMYELLLGRPKFNEVFEDVVRDRHSESLRWMKWHGNEDVSPPPPHEVNQSVPKPLSDIIMKMIAKNPDDRFSSMEELGKAIKSEFSPKGRAAGAAGKREGRLAREGRRAAGAGVAGGTGAPGKDEADELELADEAPPTAALPKSSLSLRAKLILGGVVLASFIGIVFALVIQARRAETARQQTAQQIYAEAEKKFEEGRDLKAALNGFRKLSRKRHEGTPQAAKAAVLAPFTQARMAVEKAVEAQRRHAPDARALWGEAAKHERTAREENDKLEKRSDELEEWTRETEQRLDEFAEERLASRAFVEDIVAAGDLLEGGKLAESRQTLESLEQSVDLTSEQRNEVIELRRKIAVAEFKNRVDEAIRQADELLAAQDLKSLTEAETEFKRARGMVQGSAGQILSEEDRQAYLNLLSSKLKSVETSTKYREAMIKAEEAKARDNQRRELSGLLAAVKFAPSQEAKEELNSRVTTLRADIAYNEGVNLLNKNKTDEAIAKFTHAVEINGHRQAQAQLKALKAQSARDALVAEGRVDYAAGRYPDALKKFQQAAKYGMDDKLAALMTDSRFQMKFTEAQNLRARNEYDKAEAAYAEAARIKPSEKARMDNIINRMHTTRDYEAHLAVADRALKNRDYAAARDYIRKAKAVMDTDEVEDRMNEVTYQENLEKGRREMDQRNGRPALGYFNIAKRAKDTAEVKEWIDKAEQLIEELE